MWGGLGQDVSQYLMPIRLLTARKSINESSAQTKDLANEKQYFDMWTRTHCLLHKRLRGCIRSVVNCTYPEWRPTLDIACHDDVDYAVSARGHRLGIGPCILPGRTVLLGTPWRAVWPSRKASGGTEGWCGHIAADTNAEEVDIFKV